MKIANSLNLPQPFVSAVSNEYTYTDKRYSVTAVLKGIKESVLQRRHADEIEQDVADMAWLIFGTAVHSILENSEETDTQLKENKIVADVENGYQLSGIFDLYDDKTGVVTDYKTASVWKVVYNDWDDYRKQTLLYCWILRQLGFDAHTGEIVALLKDHSKTKAKIDRDYPQHPIFVTRWEFTDNDFAEIESWLNDRFAWIERAEGMPDDEIEPCTPEERWATPDKWAAKKKGNKRAAKLFEDEAEANAYAEANGMIVEFRKGEDKKCAEYCSVCEFCNYWKENVYDA